MKRFSALLLAPALAAGIALGAPGAAHAVTDGVADASATYTLDHTSSYLLLNSSNTAFGAGFTVTESAAENVVSRTIAAGDGSPAMVWESGSTFTLRYTKVGTYTPVVKLEDEEGDVTTVTLKTITILLDTTAPKVTIRKPAKASKPGAWKVIRGTATDVGQGVYGVEIFVTEKRGKVWYAYDFGKQKWLKGYSSVTKTERRTKAMRSIYILPRPSWNSLPVKGITKGTLRVAVTAIDFQQNASVRVLTQKIK